SFARPESWTLEKNMVLPELDEPAAAPEAVLSAADMRLPHLPQKRSSAGTWFPQLEQVFMLIRFSRGGKRPSCAIGPPHEGQRAAPRSVSASHWGQTRPRGILSRQSRRR